MRSLSHYPKRTSLLWRTISPARLTQPIQVAYLKNYNLPDDPDIIWPMSTRKELREMPKIPYISEKYTDATKASKIPPMPRMKFLVRGPELVHNRLIHRQYGIQAREGGLLRRAHFMMMMSTMNHRMDKKRMFCEWRVDGPWLARAKKPTGARMGGGAGKTHHFESPVKAERIIVELGGDLEEDEARHILVNVADRLPFQARFISQEILDNDQGREQFLENNNINPFTFDYCARNNFLGAQTWLNANDYTFKGKYR